MLDWYPRTIPSMSYKTRGKVWPIVGILRYLYHVLTNETVHMSKEYRLLLTFAVALMLNNSLGCLDAFIDRHGKFA